jgi:hypothetical protein
MSITVKKLISELEKIENKFLEVEVLDYAILAKNSSIRGIREMNKKLFILLDELSPSRIEK